MSSLISASHNPAALGQKFAAHTFCLSCGGPGNGSGRSSPVPDEGAPLPPQGEDEDEGEDGSEGADGPEYVHLFP